MRERIATSLPATPMLTENMVVRGMLNGSAWTYFPQREMMPLTRPILPPSLYTSSRRSVSATKKRVFIVCLNLLPRYAPARLRGCFLGGLVQQRPGDVRVSGSGE